MKSIIVLSLSLVFLVSCKKNNVDATPKTTAELLVLAPWKLDRYSNDGGKTLTTNELNAQATALFKMYFDFKANNVVRGLDAATKEGFIAGTWYLLDNNKVIDVNVGFTGKFTIKEISKTKLVLQTTNDNYLLGVGKLVNLELSPVL